MEWSVVKAMKYDRHALILKIIEEKDIETQEELAAELRNYGMDITQPQYPGISKSCAWLR